MEKNIRVLQLSSGERIIGTIVYNSDDYYKIMNPFILKEIMTEQGISFIPVSLSNKEDEAINVKKRYVSILPYKPIKELEDMYNNLISNIIVPKLKIIQ